ncbi:isoprenoid synthase domain-containing protein [Mycena floridula]|nr:isoprenoid synthase domain-containing protein [Mycena floridula]
MLPSTTWTKFSKSLQQLRHSSSTAYCRDFVRKHDYESWLLAPFYPKSRQDDYFALKAFSIDLAMVQDSVSNPLIGKMRMQFWRDAIKNTANGKPPESPIALALSETFGRVPLPLYHFLRIIDARDAELTAPSHLTMDSLTAHAESTSSSMIYLLLSLLSIESSTVSHAASHLGVAQTLTTLLRALPFHAKNRRMVIPAEITAKHGVIQEDVFRKGNQAAGIDNAVFEFATLANDHLITARNMFDNNVPPKSLPIFLSAIPMSSVLERLEKVNFDIFDPKLQIRDWRLPFRVWKSYYLGRF